MKKNNLALQPSLTKNMILGTLGTVLLRTISLITLPIISMLLMPSEYGKASTYTMWVSIIGIFVGLQLGGSIQNSLKDFEAEKQKKYLSSVLFLAFISFIVLFTISISFAKQFAELLKIDMLMMYLLVPHCFGTFCISFFATKLLSVKKMGMNLILSLFLSIVIALASILGAKFASVNYMGYILGIAIPNIVIGFALFIYVLIAGKCVFNKEYWKYAVLFSLPLIFHMLGNVILSQCDRIMILQFMTEADMGIYTMMHTIAALIGSLWSAFNSAFIPYFYDFLKEKNSKMIMKRSINYSIVFTIITIGFMLISPELLKLIIDSQYLSGIKILPFLIAGQYLVFAYSFSVNFEFYNKKTKWIALGTIATAIINIVLNYFMIPVWGIMGAAVATAIAYLVLVIFHELIARLIIKNYPIHSMFNIINVLAICVALVIFFLLYDFWYFRWILGACLGIGLVIRIIKTKTLI